MDEYKIITTIADTFNSQSKESRDFSLSSVGRTCRGKRFIEKLKKKSTNSYENILIPKSILINYLKG